MQFSFKETENTVFSGFICHMGSVVLFVILSSWFLIASIGNKPKCFQTYQHMFYYFFQPRTFKAFPSSSPLLPSPPLSFPLLAQLLQLPAGAPMSHTNLCTICYWKVTFVISLSLFLIRLLVWILASVATCKYPGYLFWRSLLNLNKTYSFLSNLVKTGPMFRSCRKLEEESSK